MFTVLKQLSAKIELLVITATIYDSTSLPGLWCNSMFSWYAFCHFLIFCVSFSSCLNNGVCIDGVNQYSCRCAPGYTGSNCQYHINPCDSNPCMNGATCFNRDTSYTCFCPYGFTGPRCEVRIYFIFDLECWKITTFF